MQNLAHALRNTARSLTLSGGWTAAAACAVLALTVLFAPVGNAASPPVKEGDTLPVILDTDIGGDIDDTWALGLLLQCPELDVKLVSTEVADTRAKAAVVAKFLDTMGRADIPVGIGVREHKNGSRQDEWAKGYTLSDYPGTVHKDGADALIKTIKESSEPITVIAIGPVPTLAEALRREPGIAKQAHFVGMHGSIYRGYGGSSEPDAEYNVVQNVPASQRVFTADWKSMTITPLDTCGIVQLAGERYQKVLNCNTTLTDAIIGNYRAWYPHRLRNRNRELSEEEIARRVKEKLSTSSTTLFDTVAVYLAISHDLVKMKTLGVRVDDEGYTRVDEDAQKMQVAIEWKDLDAFKDWLVERLCSE